MRGEHYATALLLAIRGEVVCLVCTSFFVTTTWKITRFLPVDRKPLVYTGEIMLRAHLLKGTRVCSVILEDAVPW